MSLLLKIWKFLRGGPIIQESPAISMGAGMLDGTRADSVHAHSIKCAQQATDEDSLIINVLFADELLSLLSVDSRLKPEARLTIYASSKSFAVNTTVMAVTPTGIVLRTRKGTMREDDKICYSISNGGRLELHYSDTLKNVVVGDEIGGAQSVVQYFNWAKYAHNWIYTGNIRDVIHASSANYLTKRVEFNA